MKRIIRNDDKWLDTDKNVIFAHCPTIFFDENTGQYIWIGCNTEFSVKGGNVWHSGIRMYCSDDFCNWESKGIIVPASDDLNSPLHSARMLDREKLIFSEKTGKYVLWAHILGNTRIEDQYVVVMQSDRIDGPYEIVKKQFYPANMGIGDFTFHTDAKTGKIIWFLTDRILN